jgi:mannose-6-phosphate isomerase-like protein (cupin superfamily)
MAEVDVLCHDTAMLSLLAFLLALALAPQQAPSPTSGTFISADEVANTLKQSIANNTVDQPIKGLSVNGHRATVAMLHRKTAETSALIHDRVTEIYQVIEGSGTIVTGGTLADPKVSDLTRLGAGPSHTGTAQGGESRRIGPKDIIIIPAGMPHHFSQLDGPISYLVYRFDPKSE